MNIAVLCSGKGTNLQAIIDAVKAKVIKAQLRLVVGDKKDAFSLERARGAGIRTVFVNPKKFKSKESFDREVVKYLEEEKINLVVLAGFMRILSSYFVKRYKNKILNIHPALLPSFKGSHAIKDAWGFGVRTAGVTVHFVDEELDNGPIILQEGVQILDKDTVDSLEEKIHKIEHKLYPEAIKLFCENKLKIIGRKVKILFIILAFFASFFISFEDVSAEPASQQGGNEIVMLRYSSLPSKLRISKNINTSLSASSYDNLDSFFSGGEEKKDKSDGWRSLTDDEIRLKKKEFAYTSAKVAVEFFNSIYMPYISKGIFNIIGTTYRIDEYQKQIKDKHGLSVNVGLNNLEIHLIYKREY